MKTKFLLVLLAAQLAGYSADAQVTRYLVRFRDKGSNNFSLANPDAFLSVRSLQRRTRYQIALDSTDLPVSQRYLDSLRVIPGVAILNTSKWLNQVSIQATDAAALNRINALPFVLSAAPISFRMGTPAGPQRNKWEQPEGRAATGRFASTQADNVNYGASDAQVRIHNGQFLHNIGLRGEGMLIGMVDAGYQNYLTVSSLDSIRRNGQILGTWDFVARESSVNEDHPHGLQCFTTIAANLPGSFVGTAYKANFLLFRTEDAATETPIEEHNWAAGAERIDSSGGDLISSSLGYYDFDAPFNTYNYNFSDLNGNTTISARAADLAAKKGLLVVTAAGNEGNKPWGRIITPADADSVLTVGAVNAQGVPGSFTSRGPSADGQVKPDVASVGVGTIIQYPTGPIAGGNGTSFATPNLAGLITCLWQGFPEFNNMKIIDAVRRSGSRFHTPNDTTGYGIPDMKKALMQLTADFSSATITQLNGCRYRIGWTSKDVATMRYELERNIPGQTGFSTVATISGQGQVFGSRSYTFEDSLVNAPAGTITYRIRQVFDTAAASFSAADIDQITLSLGAACTATGLNTPLLADQHMLLLPNPSVGDLVVAVRLPRSFAQTQLSITDASGRLVWTQQQSLPSGTSRINLFTARLAAGTYYVSLSANGQLLGTRELTKL